MSKGILLSGGIDSICLAYWLKPSFAFTIDYGQVPSKAEIQTSTHVASTLGLHHEVIKVDCSSLGSGELLNKPSLSISPSTEWWPYRNQLLVTLASMKGISLGISELMVASVKSDNFHRDGTEEFYDRINGLMTFQEGSIEISCPAISMTSVDLVRKSNVPLEILLWAHSCHTSDVPCGRCPGCLKYLLVMQELGLD
ncbi:MAG TPA: 7-cyano-7-deazaguanine synthase [Nitrososphaeraceae archaeon]|nr:7-cyano-7-deazaguanine synthase [Nitrososphaeraceae archaeon]